MATVRISDVIEPQVFMDYQAMDTTQKTELISSGIVVSNEMLNAKAATGGRIVDLPFWKDLSNTEPNISNDDPAVTAPTENIGTAEQVARIAYLNKAFQAADLASDIAGSDALERISASVTRYWNRQFQARVLSTLKGIKADNIAANAGDMVFDVATDAVGAASASEKFSADNFINAAFTMGDAVDGIGAIAVHSVVYMSMVKQNLITFVKNSENSLVIPYYLGKVVIRDDTMPVVVGTNRVKYTSVLFGYGCIGFGEATPDNAVEVYREPLKGNGGGIESLITRKTWLLHPFGYKFNSASIAGTTPTHAELELATNWERVAYERKQVPIAFLVTNG